MNTSFIADSLTDMSKSKLFVAIRILYLITATVFSFIYFQTVSTSEVIDFNHISHLALEAMEGEKDFNLDKSH